MVNWKVCGAPTVTFGNEPQALLVGRLGLKQGLVERLLK